MVKSLEVSLAGVALALGLALGSCADGLGPAARLKEPPSSTDGGTRSDAGAGGGASDGGLTASTACGVINARQCDYLVRCGLVGDGGVDLQRCLSMLGQSQCGPSLWPSRVAAGTLRFNAASASACATDYQTRSCPEYGAAPSPCTRIASPGSNLNDRCYGGPEQECSSGTCRGLACPGSCLPPAGDGDDCASPRDCDADAGLYCRPVGAGASGTCLRPTAKGEPCADGDQCAEGLLCQEGICTALPKVGEACVGDNCVASAWCAPGPEGDVCAYRLLNGSPCLEDRQCMSSLVCVRQSHRCEVPGPLSAAEPCGFPQTCEPGLSCVGVTPLHLGSCSVARAEGESCLGHPDCASHLACSGSTVDSPGTCRRRARAGERCGTDRECQLISRCVAGSCVALAEPGQPCTGGECLRGVCRESADAGSTCSQPAGASEPCQRGSECASGRCVAGSCLAACMP